MRPTVPSFRRRRGFTFVEVLLSVALLACLAGVVAAAMPVATLSRAKAEMVDTASAIAQKQMEAARGVGYANLTPTGLSGAGLIDSTTTDANGAYAFTNVDNAMSDSPATALPSGTGTLLVEQVDIELRRLTVRVAWSERGKARAFTLSTLVANL